MGELNEEIKGNNAIVVGSYWWGQPGNYTSNLEDVDEVFIKFEWSDDMIRFTDPSKSFLNAIMVSEEYFDRALDELVIDTKDMTIHSIQPFNEHIDLVAVTDELNQ